MPSIGTVIGKIRCRVTGQLFPLYRYLELKSGLKLYQVTAEDCEEKADYIVWGFRKADWTTESISLCSSLGDYSCMAKTVVVSKELQGVTLPPNFDFVTLDTTDNYIPS